MFLCLFVGGGGSQQEMPKGLEGEEEEESKARFERRRERERARGKSGKRKNIKDRDWILRKKEVRSHFVASIGTCTHYSNPPPSSTGDEAKTMSQGTRNIRGGSANLSSELFRRIQKFVLLYAFIGCMLYKCAMMSVYEKTSHDKMPGHLLLRGE